MKTALITGASRGIGAKTAEILAQNGYRVIINYNKSEKEALALCENLNSMGGSAFAVRADLSKSSEIKEMFEKIKEISDGVDLLVNNAGIADVSLFTDVSEEKYDEIFNVNMKSVFLCSKYCAPFMINKKCGKIINISSMWGITGASCEAVYSASKAAVIGFTKALAKELAPSGITVNCIAPGVIETDMNKNLSDEDLDALKEEIPLARFGKSEDVANTVLFLASPSADYITGQVISTDGGMVI